MATQQVNLIVHDKPDANIFCVPTVKKCRELNSILGSISEHESGIILFDQSIQGTQSGKHSQIGKWKSGSGSTMGLMEKAFDLYKLYGTTSGRPLLELLAAKLFMLYGGAHTYRYIWKLCQNIVHKARSQIVNLKPTWETCEILRRKGKAPTKRLDRVWKPAQIGRRSDFFALSMTSSATALRSTLDDMYHRASGQPMGFIKDQISLVYEEEGDKKVCKVLQQPADLFPPPRKPHCDTNLFKHLLKVPTLKQLAI